VLFGDLIEKIAMEGLSLNVERAFSMVIEKVE
jgi:hypothetical protein